MSNQNIRPATLLDANAIAHVHVEGWRSTYRGLMPDALLDGLSAERRALFWARHLEDRASTALILVAEHQADGIIGFAAAGRPEDPIPGYDVELWAIYLLDAHRGGGVGRALMRAVAAQLDDRGQEGLFLWVLAGNSAQRFYEALGGRRLHSAYEEFSGLRLEKIAYGWERLAALMGGR